MKIKKLYSKILETKYNYYIFFIYFSIIKKLNECNINKFIMYIYDFANLFPIFSLKVSNSLELEDYMLREFKFL